MALKSATITLGGDTYEVSPFTIDQLEEIGDLLDGKTTAATMMKILKVALRNAKPEVKPEDAGKLRVAMTEVVEATKEILKLSGVDVSAVPPAATPPVA